MQRLPKVLSRKIVNPNREIAVAPSKEEPFAVHKDIFCTTDGPPVSKKMPPCKNRSSE
jgi:hypothetical protein